MNQIFNQSKNKRIIVISFQSLSPISNTAINVFDLFASFKAANSLNHWNLSLIQAVQNCILVGHIDPHVIMLGGSENYLEIIKLAWMKQILKSPLGFTIQYLGELCNFLVSKTPQCSTVQLEEAICQCVSELVNTGLPSNLKYIIRHITKFLPMTGDHSVNDNENSLSTEMIRSSIDGLQQKGLVYNTGHGYNVMTADKLRVAKWLGELPDIRMSFNGSDNEEKRATMQTLQSIQKSNNRFLVNREHSDNTEDCLSCYDLRGNKYYNQPSPDQKIVVKECRGTSGTERYRANYIDNIKVVSTDTSLNKPRMLCSNVSKKELPKRPTCVKYESNFISRIICGMKKLRIHWPAKNGVVRSTNIGVPEVYNKKYFTAYRDDSNVINSRLSQSMYAFNQINGHGPEDPLVNGPNTKYLNNATCRSPFSPTDLMINEHFIPYGETKSTSPVECYGINYPQNDIDRSFILMDEQRCCSELMLTARSSVLTPNLYPMVPLQHLSGCDHISSSDATKTKTDRKDDISSNTINDHAAIPSLNNRYFSPFTCDSGFNSVHGAALPENDTSQSKTSSPPDINLSKKLSSYSCQQNLYGGPCAWQVNSLNDSIYQARNYQSSALPPVIESSRFMK